MWSTKRRQDAAVNAIVHLVQDAVLQIRTLAYRREDLLVAVFPETDYQEQIRLLADVCDTLVPGLRRGTGYTPTEALQQTWDSRSEQQRRWLRQTLASHGLAIHDLITVPPTADHDARSGTPPEST